MSYVVASITFQMYVLKVTPEHSFTKKNAKLNYTFNKNTNNCGTIPIDAISLSAKRE